MLYDIDQCKTPVEARSAAKLDYEISVESLYAAGLQVPNAKALRLKSPSEDKIISVVSDNWHYYPVESFVQDFFFIAELTGAKPSKLGTVDRFSSSFQESRYGVTGRLELPEFDLLKDGYKTAIIFSDNYKMDKGINLDFETTRLVCKNGMVTRAINNRISIAHLEMSRQRVFDAVIKLAWEIDCQRQILRRLAQVQLTEKQVQDIVIHCFGVKDEQINKQPETVQLILKIYNGEKDFDRTLPANVQLRQIELGDTAIGLLNAVTAFTQHYRLYSSDAVRYYSQLDGDSQRLQQKFMNNLVTQFATDIQRDYRKQKSGNKVPVGVFVR
jgi:Domain of unknown function (DUF932)